MVSAKSEARASFFVNRDIPPPIEVVCTQAKQLVIARYEADKWRTRPLFPWHLTYERDVHTSPNREWLYVWSLGVFIGRLEPSGTLRRMEPAEFLCLFAPNSQYLLGEAQGISAYTHNLVLYELPSGKARTLSEGHGELGSYGWYPDSRHIWYELVFPRGKGKQEKRFYRQDVATGQRRLLKENEVRPLSTAWQLLDQRFRRHRYSLSSGYCYSRHQQVRLFAIGSQPEVVRGRKTGFLVRPFIYIQRRDGNRKLVLRPNEHRWEYVYGLDISEDGEWALLFVSTKVAETKDEDRYDEAIVLLHIPTRRVKTIMPVINRGRSNGFGLFPSRATPFQLDLCYFGLGSAGI